MANQQYLFWVMTGALTLLFIFVSVLVGKSQTPKRGLVLFGVLMGIMIVLDLVLIN